MQHTNLFAPTAKPEAILFFYTLFSTYLHGQCFPNHYLFVFIVK